MRQKGKQHDEKRENKDEKRRIFPKRVKGAVESEKKREARTCVPDGKTAADAEGRAEARTEEKEPRGSAGKRRKKEGAGGEICDHLLPTPASSVPFYEGLRRAIGGDIEGALEEHFNEWVRKEQIPFFPIPVVTLNGVFRQYNFKEFKTDAKKLRLAQSIRIEEDPPCALDRPREKTVQRIIGDKFEEIRMFLEEPFKKRQIWSIKEIEKYYSARKSGVLSDLKWSVAKKVLPCVAFTYRTGPWKNMWVKYGCNPKKLPASYVHQVYMWKNVSKAFVVQNNAKILKMLEENPEYTTEEFSVKTGFITQKGFDAIYQALSDVEVPQKEQKEDVSLFGGLDFKLLDEDE